MWFEIHKSGVAQYWWNIKASNGETLAHSEILSSKQTCKNAIAVVKAGAASAETKDLTGES